MRAISTTAFLSVLALASSLTAVVRASGPREQCSETADIPDGATCSSIGAKFGLSQDDTQSMNPTISCYGPLPAGGRLCVSGHKPGCARQVSATDTTCDGLVASLGLTVGVFVAYNDDVNGDCSNLVIGQSYCVAVD